MDCRDDGNLSSANLNPSTSPEPIDKSGAFDRISVLPEDILIPIVSSLTLREAAQTSILSRSWRFLWMKTMNLEFDIKNMTGKDEREHYQDSNLSLENKRLTFVVWVDRILNIHDGPKIKSFRVTYDLGTDHSEKLRQWIQALATKQVETLHVNFADPKLPHEFIIHPVFPIESLLLPHQEDEGNVHLKHLTLGTCALMPKTVSVGLRNILSLSLQNTAINQEIMNNIICSCLFLESLSITHCHASCQLLTISNDDCNMMNLRHLNISYSSYLIVVIVSGAPRLSSVEQRGKNLLRVHLMNSAIPIRLCLDPPKERERVDQIFHDLSTGYSQIEALLLNLNIQQGYKKKKPLPVFTKLREIVLMIQGPNEGDLIRLIAWFMRTSPFLEKLELHLPGSNKDGESSNINVAQNLRQLKNKRNSRHGVPRGGNLKEVKLFNFNGENNHLQLALFLLKNVDALERMIIDRQGKVYEGEERRSQSSITPQVSKQQVQEMMLEQVPSSVMLDVQ